jgi:hypothetical protein
MNLLECKLIALTRAAGLPDAEAMELLGGFDEHVNEALDIEIDRRGGFMTEAIAGSEFGTQGHKTGLCFRYKDKPRECAHRLRHTRVQRAGGTKK